MSIRKKLATSFALAILCVLAQSCSLPPEFVGPTYGPAASYAIGSYVAFGDSITYGATLAAPATQAYPALVAGSRGWTFNDYANGGDMACDLFPRQILPNRIAFGAVSGRAYSVLIGTNDVDVRGTGSYEGIFKNCHFAAIAWLATRPQDKVLPGDPSVHTTGACSSSSADTAFNCSAPGTLSLDNFSSTGTPIYVWYSISDSDSAGTFFTVTVDGVTSIAYTRPQTTLLTNNGSSTSIGILRIIPGSSGAHTVQIATSTGGVSILAIGTNRAIKPIVLSVGDIPNQLLSSPQASVASQLLYSADIQADIADAVADNLDVRFVPDRKYMLGTSAEMSDTVHPNALGHQHLAFAFESVFP